jgi:predicted transcriptional regulator
MDIDLVPEELRPFVKEQLAAGRSFDELLGEALRLLRFNEDCFSKQIGEGMAAEERGELHDGEEALAEIRSELEARRE